MSSQQFTSIDPGNVPGGLFWTVLVSDDNVHVDLDDGTAVMQVSNLATLDFQNIQNDLLHGPAIPTTVSFTVQWSGLRDRDLVRIPLLSDGSPGFIARLAQSTSSGATVAWSADEPTAVVNGVKGVHYGADAGAAVAVLYAGLGRERNGVFFRQGRKHREHEDEDEEGHDVS
jgi:hypothetical protein